MLTKKQLARKKVVRKAFVEYVRLHYAEHVDPTTANLSRCYDLLRPMYPPDKILLSTIKSLSIRGLTGTVDGVSYFVEADESYDDSSRFLRAPVKVLSV